MKISINFYLDELKPNKDYLTLNNLAISGVIITLIMMIWLSVLVFSVAEAEQETALLKNNTAQAQKSLQQLQQQLVKHNDKGSFEEKKVTLETQLKSKLLLLESVGKRLQTTRVDYYLVMKELTEHHDHDLWLSAFSFNQNAAWFSGFALDSSAVTRWMSYLQSSHSFKGLEFSHLDVKVVSNDVTEVEGDELMQFNVATSLDAIKSKEIVK